VYVMMMIMVYLFLGKGLSWSVDEKSLKDAFSSFGQVTEGNLSINQSRFHSNFH